MALLYLFGEVCQADISRKMMRQPLIDNLLTLSLRKRNHVLGNVLVAKAAIAAENIRG